MVCGLILRCHSVIYLPWVTFTLTSDLVHSPNLYRVLCISPLLFEVGILNLVCGWIVGWQNVAYHFQFTVTLTSDLITKIIVA